MSDIPGPPFSTPEEARQYIEHQQQEAKIKGRDMIHRVSDLIDSLNDEQLGTLEYLTMALCNDPSYAGYVHGQVDTVRELKFGTCRCGTDHDEELAQEFSTPPENQPDIETTHKDYLDAGAMKKYHIEFVPDDLNDVYPTKYRCANCFTPIVSIEDRMLRAPGIDGCSGCQQMSKNGTKWYGR